MVLHRPIMHYPTAEAAEILANALDVLEKHDPGIDAGERDALVCLRARAERWDLAEKTLRSLLGPAAAVLHEE